MDVQRAVEKTRAGATGAIFLDSSLGGLFDLWMIGQAQVAVGTEHYYFPAVHQDLGILRGRNCAEVGVNSQAPQLVSRGEVPDLLKERQCSRTGRGLSPDDSMVELP